MHNNETAHITSKTLKNLGHHCYEQAELAARGAAILKQSGSCHGPHDLSPEELVEVAKQYSDPFIFSSPAITKWRNLVRQH